MEIKNKLLLLLAVGLSVPALLFGQGGAGVYGPMHVANGGTFLVSTEGSLLVNAGTNPTNGTGQILNKGTIVVKKGLILKSNDAADGLLANNKTVTIEAAAADVQVRKVFTSDKWYLISFPFDVNVDNVKKVNGTGGLDNLTYSYSTPTSDSPFYVEEYDGDTRAKNNDNSAEAVWVIVKPGSTLKAGVGYLFQASQSLASTEVVFSPATATAATGMYNDARSISLANHIYDDYRYETQKRAGWNAAGSLSTANFKITSDMTYKGGLQFWTGEQYTSISPLLGTFVMAPYCAYLTQVENREEISPGVLGDYIYTKNGNVYDYLVFKNQNNTLESYSTSPILRSDAPSTLDIINLSLEGAGFTDKLQVAMSGNFKESISFNEDVSKLLTPNLSVPQVWNLYKNYNLSINLLPSADSYTLALGVRTGETGDYTFSLENGYNGYYGGVQLLDKELGIRTNLLEKPYRFTAGTLNTTERFVLELNRSPLALDEMAKDAVLAYVNQGILQVKGIQTGDKIDVYDLTGRMVLSAKAADSTFSRRIEGDSKVLIVRISGKTNKAMKVMNNK